MNKAPVFELVAGGETVYAGSNYMVAECKFQAVAREAKKYPPMTVTLYHNGTVRREYNAKA
jgi:hypothetical protein